MFGSHRATAGDKASVCTNIWLKRMNRIYVKARAIPRAIFQPIPPLRFFEDNATPMIVSTNAENGRANRVCFSIRAYFTFASSLMDWISIISLSSS